jgi:PAS domain S-box-containing protein
VSKLQILAASLDAIIRRRRSAEQLHTSEAQYRMLFDINPHPMWIYESTNLRMLAVNRAALNHYGYSEQEFLGMTLRDFRPTEDVAEPGKIPGAALEHSISGLWRHVKKDGSLIEVEVVDRGIDFSTAGRPGWYWPTT